MITYKIPIKQEAGGSSLAGKITNFQWYHIIWYGYLYNWWSPGSHMVAVVMGSA